MKKPPSTGPLPTTTASAAASTTISHLHGPKPETTAPMAAAISAASKKRRFRRRTMASDEGVSLLVKVPQQRHQQPPSAPNMGSSLQLGPSRKQARLLVSKRFRGSSVPLLQLRGPNSVTSSSSSSPLPLPPTGAAKAAASSSLGFRHSLRLAHGLATPMQCKNPILPSNRTFNNNNNHLTQFLQPLQPNLGTQQNQANLLYYRDFFQENILPRASLASSLLASRQKTALVVVQMEETHHQQTRKENNIDDQYQEQQIEPNEYLDLIKKSTRLYGWHWDKKNKSDECHLSKDRLEVCFHPECSESAAAVTGTKPLTKNRQFYYWEVTVFEKTYGTSVMFGLCTKQQQMHSNDYCNLIGLDEHGWSLSHKGYTWHNGAVERYTNFFPQNQSVTIGMLFTPSVGELTYFINGKNAGVAFTGLDKVELDLYPVIGSTAKCTRMRLDGAWCSYNSFFERAGMALLTGAWKKVEFIKYLQDQRVPELLVGQLAQLAEDVWGSDIEESDQEEEEEGELEDFEDGDDQYSSCNSVNSLLNSFR